MNRSIGILCVNLFLFCSIYSEAQLVKLEKAEIPAWKINIPPGLRVDSIPSAISINPAYHQGKCLLSSGETLSGYFQLVLKKPAYNAGIVSAKVLFQPPAVVLHKQLPEAEPVEIPIEEIKELVVYGKESGAMTSGDSTRFFYSPDNTTLIRLRIDSTITLYDNLKLVDELETGNIDFWFTIVLADYKNTIVGNIDFAVYDMHLKPAKPIWEWVDWLEYQFLKSSGDYFIQDGDKISRLSGWKDMKGDIRIDPYIKQVFDTLSLNSPKDICFAIEFSLSQDKSSFLPFLTKIEIYLSDGSKLSGQGYIQPALFSGNYVGSLIHFTNGTEFKLITPPQVDSVLYNGKAWMPVWDSFNKQYYLTYPWVYEGVEYRILEETEKNNNYFRFSRTIKYRVYKYRRKDVWTWDSNEVLLKAFKKTLSE